MGAKTGLLVYADGAAPELLRHVGAADPERTAAMMRRLYPGWVIDGAVGSFLSDGVYPPEGQAYAASWPGVELICDRRMMVDLPSQLPADLVAAGVGRRMVLHAMHSVVDWLTFAVWEDGRLVRSLSLSPGSGIVENIGDPLPFELPYWAGGHPVDVIPRPNEDEKPYPLPFHPLELGEDALRALCGFILEGLPAPDDVDADTIALHGFLVQDPQGPSVEEREEALRAVMEAMGPSRVYTLSRDGSLVKRDFPSARRAVDSG